MLHLLPIKLALQGTITLVAVLLIAALSAGLLSQDEIGETIFSIIRWSSFIVILITVAATVLWRWITPIQMSIFPYLGGKWSGEILFDSGGTTRSNSVSIEIKHKVFEIKMLFESEESKSRPLTTHAEKEIDFERFRLFYVFQNERKEGAPNAGRSYKGVAVLRVDHRKLIGDYFTEAKTSGRIILERDSTNPWWKVWC